MLKGQVFKEQIFENQIFAVFINTFLNGKNGIIDGYKNSMAVSAGSNTVTVQSGVICIQGRFLEEDTYTTLPVTTETAYCSLVVEINLDNINTDIDFTQGYYKILKNANNYPVLTQDDIVNTNSGIYQYEIARFKTSLNGISDFVDLRSYIDYESLYKEIETKLNEIENESYFLPRSEFDDVKDRIKEPFPVGAIYLSMTSVNPTEYFGGTWVQIAKGRTLIGVSQDETDYASSNLLGGKSKYKLTKEQLPDYDLTINDPGHKHSYKFGSIGNVYGAQENGARPGDVIIDSAVNGDFINSAKTGITVSSGGNGEEIDNRPLYVTCYIWQRTA